jgi:TonB family protein
MRVLIDAARAAGVRLVSLVGIDEYSQPSPEGRAVLGGLPYFAHLLQPRPVAIDVIVREPQPDGCRGDPEARAFGTVGPADAVVLNPWPSKELLPGLERPVTLGGDDPGASGLDGGSTTACLMLGADVTATSAFRAAVRATDRGFQVFLSPRSIDVSAPPPPPAPAGGALAALLAGDAGAGPGVMGSLPRETIQRVVRRNIEQIKRCYQRELQVSPALTGRVTVKFVIAPSGAVQEATIRDSNLGRPEVESCITRAVRRWRFPRPEGGGMVVVSYPFVFTPAGG